MRTKKVQEKGDMNHTIPNGLFIVFEGGEGSGKTTQARLLSEWLTTRGYDILVTKQPGGDDGICKRIREILLDPHYFKNFSPPAELLLFMADKAQHADSVIRPALAKGKIVVCDRYLASSYTYQVVARKGCTKEEFDIVAHYALHGLQPHLTVWLDVDPENGLQRNSAVPSQQLRFEKENFDFHLRVRRGYKEYFAHSRDSSTVLRVDANQSIEKNHTTIISHMATLLNL